MIDYLKSWFRQPTPLELITRELAEAYISRLGAQTGADFAHSVVDYNTARIKRLEALLSHHGKDTK